MYEAEEGRVSLAAVLFDMDGLLVDSEPLWFEAEKAVMERLDGDWTHADQLALFGGSLRRSAGYLLSRGRREATVDEVASWLVGTMAGLVTERELPLMPGAIDLLGQVRAAGLPAALVTSSERVIADAVLARLAGHGVEFGTTVCAEDVRNHKPHPEPYQRAASLLGADPAGCVALEDSPNGAASAASAGCRVVAVPSLVPIAPVPGRRMVVPALTEVSLAEARAVLDVRFWGAVAVLMHAASPHPKGGSIPGGWTATLVGFVPARAPERAATGTLNRPTTEYGGSVAAPVFSKILQYALRHFDIAPPSTPAPPACSGAGAAPPSPR